MNLAYSFAVALHLLCVQGLCRKLKMLKLSVAPQVMNSDSDSPIEETGLAKSDS